MLTIQEFMLIFRSLFTIFRSLCSHIQELILPEWVIEELSLLKMGLFGPNSTLPAGKGRDMEPYQLAWPICAVCSKASLFSFSQILVYSNFFGDTFRSLCFIFRSLCLQFRSLCSYLGVYAQYLGVYAYIFRSLCYLSGLQRSFRS